MAWADTQDQRLIELAKQAVEAACNEPEHFDMTMWATSCGSVKCVCGWMVFIADPSGFIKSAINKNAADFVDGWRMANASGEEFMRLFSRLEWPDRFVTSDYDRSGLLPTTEAQLRERFAYWLETGK